MSNIFEPALYERHGMFHYPEATARISNWFLAAPPGSYLMGMMAAVQLQFWHDDRRPDLGYHCFHHMFEALYFADSEFKKNWDRSAKFDRSIPHFVQRSFNRKATKANFRKLFLSSPVHKLTHKVLVDGVKKGTVLHKVLNGPIKPGQSHPMSASYASKMRVTILKVAVGVASVSAVGYAMLIDAVLELVPVF